LCFQIGRFGDKNRSGALGAPRAEAALIMITRRRLAAAAALGAALVASPALAGTGQPSPWQMGLQGFVTEIGHEIDAFHNWLLVLITLISLFVLGLMIYVIWRFNEKANPTPTKTTHNQILEVAWTVVPILILLGIAFPSFRLLRHQLIIPPADLVVKATGKSWFWEYEYPKDYGGFSFASYMLKDEERTDPANQPRLLAVTNEVVVPVNKTVVVQVTSGDVLHAFALPSFGIKIDAVPGRLNQTWFKAEREGVYYGQCSELCGREHAYMPIAFRVVSQEKYDAWLAEAKQKFASVEPGGETKVAARLGAAY
jgi:cytochrome c oxidase subunit 2